ncbi:Stc1 domain-containing protein [Pestalotiopsis sp. NC0098]|nr:Stc1 domain-containing protein [Pestalotiopsis sp. NC0098]
MSSSTPNVPALAGDSRNDQALPSAFKCRVGGEWKPSDCFSKNQLAKWHQARRSRNSTTNAANIGLTCREHSGEPNLGLHCNGPCGLWKAREQFSTNQRRNNLRWCIACTQWQAEQTYDSIPQAAPNEVNEDTHEHEGVTDLAGGIGFDDDDEDYSDDGIITSSSLTTRTYDDGDYNGSDDDDDNYHQGIAEEDYNPTASVYGHGHYFEPDEDEESSDDDNITVSNVGPARNPSQGSAVGTTDTQQAAADRLSSHAAPLALSDAQVSGPAFSSSFGPDSHAGHNFAEDWVPEHLGRNDNLAALRTGGLLQRHVLGSGSNTPSGSIMSASGQTEIGLPRYTASSVRHGTSASFLSSAASVVSSDSRAGLATVSNGSQAGSNDNRRSPGAQSYDAYDAQGNVHRRVARPGNSTTAGSSRVSNQRSQTLKAPKGNGNFARVEQRKNFDVIRLPKAQTGANHIAVYDSGSEDEF